ncbi:MAG: primosomal protein DnaI [Caryophanon sp.]|nr:primosomal protein DnaI [Caryophanon sp.]
MEPINEAMKRAMPVSFQERYEQLKREILEEPRIRSFLLANRSELTEDAINRSIPKLQEFLNQSATCCGANATPSCTNMMNGMIPELFIVRGTINIQYRACKQRLIEEERRNIASRISSMYMSKDVLKATLRDLYLDDRGRIDITEKAADFVNTCRDTGKLPSKGLYIYGSFGVGKSFVLGAIANDLATLNIQTVMVFVPEFLRELKNAIGDNTLQQKLDFVKKAQVLMLDDLGAEAMTAWTRDEILATILQYRMNEQLPTFITSNFDYVELERNLGKSQKGDNEPVKARRIMDRIKAMTIPMRMDGENRRV